jgi:hypothetical protein
MKKVCITLLALTLFILSGCGGYVKSYSASILVTSCQNNNASMKFASFKGTYNFKLRRSDTNENTLNCTASLDEGEVKIYIGVDGKKELVSTVKGGESGSKTIKLNDKYLNEKTLYIIIESVDKCKGGDFRFQYN